MGRTMTRLVCALGLYTLGCMALLAWSWHRRWLTPAEAGFGEVMAAGILVSLARGAWLGWRAGRAARRRNGR